MIKLPKDDKIKSIQCGDKCQRYFHPECVKLSYTEASKYSNPRINDRWSCGRHDCVPLDSQPQNILLTQLTLLTNTISTLSTKVDALTSLPSKVDSLIAQMDTLNKNLQSLECRVVANEVKINDLELNLGKVKDLTTPEDTIAEINDRTRRANNLIIFKLPESSSTNLNTRVQKDTANFRKFLDFFVPELSEVDFKCHRVGKPRKDQIRPVKVIFCNSDHPRAFMSSFKKEALVEIDSCFSEVSVARDRTDRERQHLNHLRIELDERLKKGEINLTIKYNNGIPSIVKSVPKN